MTREILFRTGFETQFASYLSWAASREPNIQRLAPSDFPSFIVELGPVTIATYDSNGRPVAGRQEFTVTLRESQSQLALTVALTARSDIISRAQIFFAGNYAAPAVVPGDAERIDGVVLLKIDPAPLRKTDTRQVITLHCAYDFTVF